MYKKTVYRQFSAEEREDKREERGSRERGEDEEREGDKVSYRNFFFPLPALLIMMFTAANHRNMTYDHQAERKVVTFFDDDE